jgi:hypothetical protein
MSLASALPANSVTSNPAGTFNPCPAAAGAGKKRNHRDTEITEKETQREGTTGDTGGTGEEFIRNQSAMSGGSRTWDG